MLITKIYKNLKKKNNNNELFKKFLAFSVLFNELCGNYKAISAIINALIT